MEIKDIAFSYDKKVKLLKSINTSVEKGEITTIIGPNGSGKSTLLGVLCRHLTAETGQVVLDGKDSVHYKPKEFAKKLAIVHQQNEAPSDMTVENIVAFGRLPYKSIFQQPRDEDRESVEWALSCTNLTEKRKLTIDKLSGGEKQRVWIAMSLAQKTSLLLLDEPTTYLDIYYQFEVLEFIKGLNKAYGLTILMVLHDINQAIKYSDQIIVMKDGEVYMKGTPKQVITKETMKHIYGVDVVLRDDKDTGLHIIPIGI
ncbi:ABC transporter ATP-binding protein [Salipaludibacillus sp. HK11]|uniref:ABC transporter ATP-binding protein n=1 Tax=Salipaludibacillus sp. HK11 TaxID=3394320 RepID=UPI0039FC8B1C